MTSKLLFPLALLLLSGCAVPVQPTAATHGAPSLDERMATLLEWFGGEFNNHEQVWQAGVSGIEPHEHLHHYFVPVSVPAVGEHTFYVQQHMNADPDNIYRQRLYLFTPNLERDAVQLTIFSFPDDAAVRNAHLNPEVLREFSPEQLRSIPGCEVYWHWNGEYFNGNMDEGACTFISQRSGKRITIIDDLKLTDSEIWVRDVARDEEGNLVFGDPEREHHRNRKVRYYQGWAAVKRDGMAAAADAQDWIDQRDLRLHNEGSRHMLRDEQGTASGLIIELSRVTHQNSGTAVLKLAVIDAETERTLAYSWAEPDAARIGISLGWMQAGFALSAP